VIDPQSQAILQDVLRRESRSLLSYIGDAYPWAAVGQTETAAALKNVVADERAAVAALGRFLVRQHITPPPGGAYPTRFTTCNFIALDYLLKRLEEAQLGDIAALHSDLAEITDKEARQQVANLLAVKEKTLAFLQRSLDPAMAGSS
jgi:hypothetical protein